MFQDNTILEYTDKLAKKDPVPGGGGTSALVAAVGSALVSMVGSLTAGKEKYAAVEEDVLELMEQCRSLRKELLKCMDEDAEAFLPLAKAYAIPKDDPQRDAVMEEALTVACRVPLHIMELVRDGISVCFEMTEIGSKMAVSDAGCAAACFAGAMKAAALNVYINTKSMKNREKAEAIKQYCDEMLSEGTSAADEIYEAVLNRLKD